MVDRKIVTHCIRLLALFSPVGLSTAFLVKFQQNGNFAGDSYMKFNNQFTLPAFACSLCLRFKLDIEKGVINWLLSYSVASNPDKMNMYMNHTSKELKFCLSGSRGFENCFPITFEPHLVRHKWLHTCVVLTGLDPDTEFAKIKMFVQGKLEKTAQFKTILDPAKDGKGMMILAQEQDSFGGGFDRKQSFAGDIAQFNMFERELRDEEISNLFSCGSDLQGDVVSWSVEDWSDFGDVDIKTSDYKKLCEEPFEHELVAIPEPVTFHEASFICDYLSGKIYSVDDDLYEAEGLYQKLKENLDLKSSSCQLPSGEISYWHGNLLANSVWTDYITGEKVAREISLMKEPSSAEEACLTNEYGKLRPRKCDYKFCAFCEKLAKPKAIVMKGFCRSVTEEDYIFDREYYADGMRNGRIYFRGVRASHMFYQPGEGDSSDGRTGSWIIQSFKDDKHKMTLPPKDSKKYPFGRFNWQIGPGEGICLKPAGQLMSLTMSSCPVETFTCNTGACIPLANKCNSKIDCEDESDESQCTYLEVPSNYAGQLSPSSKGSEAVPVYFNISILALPRIDTILLSFTADYYINLRWYDGRLVFKDLNSNSLLNGVQTSSLSKLWTPQLAFINALGPYQTVVDDISVCTIVLEKTPTFNDLTQSLEYYGFDAYTNAINLEREYYQEFACEFELYFYPFDTQVCHMVFALQGFTKEFIALQIDDIGVEYTGKRNLLEYEIQDWKIFFDNTGEMSQAEVKIVFRRNVEFHLFGVFLQQMILILVGFLTFFFEVTNFTDRVMVSLTLMLVIATITASIQMTLPATPYFKMIDIWLFFSMNLMVLSLIFHTYLEHVVGNETTKNERPHSPHRRRVSVKSARTRPPSAVLFTQNKVSLQENSVEEAHPYSKRVNLIGTLLYVGVVTFFSIVFWTVAFIEFIKPADEYMDKKIE